MEGTGPVATYITLGKRGVLGPPQHPSMPAPEASWRWAAKAELAAPEEKSRGQFVAKTLDEMMQKPRESGDHTVERGYTK